VLAQQGMLRLVASGAKVPTTAALPVPTRPRPAQVNTVDVPAVDVPAAGPAPAATESADLPDRIALLR
jgi:hypothetical protein